MEYETECVPGMTPVATQRATAMSFEQMLEERGYIVYTTTGCSMQPLLRQRRDIVEIRPRHSGRYAKHDVVLYRLGGNYILHRVLRVREQDYIIAGDNNTFLDPPVSDEQVLGRMTRVIRSGKSINVDEDLPYSLYVRLWCAPWPVRMALLRVRGKLSALKRRFIC
ncbi:MAG: hypothetical protein IKF14_05555 [Atopobiaceae bacterium]|nr:hypothetical protein [Atopobiaceae bacterium]